MKNFQMDATLDQGGAGGVNHRKLLPFLNVCELVWAFGVCATSLAFPSVLPALALQYHPHLFEILLVAISWWPFCARPSSSSLLLLLLFPFQTCPLPSQTRTKVETCDLWFAVDGKHIDYRGKCMKAGAWAISLLSRIYAPDALDWSNDLLTTWTTLIATC